MSIAILVRHGESTANVKQIVTHDIEGYPLTDLGRDQAALAGDQLSSLSVGSIYTSPIQRARETADIISRKIGVTPGVEEGIIETGMGKYNNRPYSEIPRRGLLALGLEPWESHQERLMKVMGRIRGTSILVSHEYPIRSALSIFLDLDETGSYGINIRNATISVVDIEESRVLCIGSRFLSDPVKDFINSRNE